MIASSGNTNSNFVLYPAHFSQVMAVAATDASNQRASFSNYGAEIEVAAPGVNIISLWPGGYNTLSGTSMAAPYVSGLAAVLFGFQNNASIIRNDLKASALDISPAGFDIYTGAGLIQMDAALALVTSASTSTSKPNPGGQPVAPPVFISTPLSTLTPLATLTPVPITSTFTPTIAFSASPHPTNTFIQLPTTTPELEAQEQKPAPDFGSPYFCVGNLINPAGYFASTTLSQESLRQTPFALIMVQIRGTNNLEYCLYWVCPYAKTVLAFSGYLAASLQSSTNPPYIFNVSISDLINGILIE